MLFSSILVPVVPDVLNVVVALHHFKQLVHVLDVVLIGNPGVFITFWAALQDSNKFLSWVYVTTKLYCKITISQAKKKEPP